MLRSLACNVNIRTKCSERLLLATASSVNQQRGRRRTLTRVPWLPSVQENMPLRDHMLSSKTKNLLDAVMARENGMPSVKPLDEVSFRTEDLSPATRRVGLVVKKIGMVPQWTTTGQRILCTLLEVSDNHVVSLTSPSAWYKASVVGKRKAFNRAGPMWKVTVGAENSNATQLTTAYRRQFLRAGIPTKAHLGSFLVTEDALPVAGQSLDARHFEVGQFVTATGKTIDWGFQGGMHRWGMRGQPTRRTTKSHRRIGSVGSVGDARIWPGKRMPGHMGYEWRTVSGLEILRVNVDKQVIYVKGSVPGDIGEHLLLKDCLQDEKRVKNCSIPTWSPSLETIQEEPEETDPLTVLRFQEKFGNKVFQFSSPSITFTDADAKRSAGRDKTKAKIAKVKK